uniref:Uncharacterized protein n=1 Tax=Rhizophora mucronata TaxID=61149 RepID=A0A2P2R293_RHIMU
MLDSIGFHTCFNSRVSETKAWIFLYYDAEQKWNWSFRSYILHVSVNRIGCFISANEAPERKFYFLPLTQ